MLLEYIEKAMSKAKYERIKDKEPYYGEIPACKGVWATGKTLAECKKNLQEVLESWIFIRIKNALPIPTLNGKTIKPVIRVEI